MTETMLIWLFGGTWVVLGGWLVYLTKRDYDQVVRHNEMRFVLISISKKAAEFLHHSDDRFKLDRLVDKYKINEDLTYLEWIELNSICDGILADDSLATGDRVAALLLKSFATLSKSYAKHKTTPRYNAVI